MTAGMGMSAQAHKAAGRKAAGMIRMTHERSSHWRKRSHGIQSHKTQPAVATGVRVGAAGVEVARRFYNPRIRIYTNQFEAKQLTVGVNGTVRITNPQIRICTRGSKTNTMLSFRVGTTKRHHKQVQKQHQKQHNQDMRSRACQKLHSAGWG